MNKQKFTNKIIKVDGEEVVVSEGDWGNKWYIFVFVLDNKKYYIRYPEKFHSFGLSTIRNIAKECLYVLKDFSNLDVDGEIYTPKKEDVFFQEEILTGSYKGLVYFCFKAFVNGKETVVFETKENIKKILGENFVLNGNTILDGPNKYSSQKQILRILHKDGKY